VGYLDACCPSIAHVHCAAPCVICSIRPAGFPDREIAAQGGASVAQQGGANADWRQRHGPIDSWGGDLFACAPAPMFTATLAIEVTPITYAEPSSAAPPAAEPTEPGAEASSSVQAEGSAEAAAAEAPAAPRPRFSASLVLQPSLFEIHSGVLAVFDLVVGALAAVDDVPAKVRWLPCCLHEAALLPPTAILLCARSRWTGAVYRARCCERGLAATASCRP
jgi:hypothetical protein